MQDKISCTLLGKNIYHIHASNQYWLTSTFFRLAEYYESPNSEVRTKYVTFDKAMDLYAEQNGNFDYFEAWGGFNVPSTTVLQFFKRYKKNTLSKKELYLKKLLKSALNSKEKFCVIGTYEPEEKDIAESREILKHELAHAFHYLDRDYKKETNRITSSLPKTKLEKLKCVLKKEGYVKDVYNDEIQAYLSTSSTADRKHFKMDFVSKKHIKLYKDNFKLYYKEFVENESGE